MQRRKKHEYNLHDNLIFEGISTAKKQDLGMVFGAVGMGAASSIMVKTRRKK